MSFNDLRQNHNLVQALWDAVNSGCGSLANVGPLVKTLITTEGWKKREVTQLGKIVKFDRFAVFITTAPLEGCGWPLDKVERLIKDDPETLALWRDAITPPVGTNVPHDNVMTRQGNSLSYTLARLKREQPDLFDRVRTGELSANAAAIEAGFRKKPTPRFKSCPYCGHDLP